MSAKRNTRFKSADTFPQVLVMHMQRFVLENWVPKKLNLNILCDTDQLAFVGEGWVRGERPAGELLMPESTGDVKPSVDAAKLRQLMDMGFTEPRCTRALGATEGNVDAAMEWIFGRMDDATLDLPIAAKASPSSTATDA